MFLQHFPKSTLPQECTSLYLYSDFFGEFQNGTFPGSNECIPTMTFSFQSCYDFTNILKMSHLVAKIGREYLLFIVYATKLGEKYFRSLHKNSHRLGEASEG